MLEVMAAFQRDLGRLEKRVWQGLWSSAKTNGKFLTWRSRPHAAAQPRGQLARQQLCRKRSWWTRCWIEMSSVPLQQGMLIT